jgi:hypothetical protein
MNLVSALEQPDVHRQNIHVKTTEINHNEYFDIIAIE